MRDAFPLNAHSLTIVGLILASVCYGMTDHAAAESPSNVPFANESSWFSPAGPPPVWSDGHTGLDLLHHHPLLIAPPKPTFNSVIRQVAFEETTGPAIIEPRTAAPMPAADEEQIVAASCSCGTCGKCRPLTGRSHGVRFAQALYLAITNPPICYEPQWTHLGNAAIHQDPIRPQTQQRIRWDAGWNMLFPDRAEYFWARSGGGGLGPATSERSIDYHELSLYTEAAHNGFGAFVEVPYRSIYPENQGHLAGFGDIIVGTKSVLHDSEFLLIATQFRTHLPTGVASKGLGTEHVSLEPSLLVGVHLAPKTYLQMQIAEWIPLGGDSTYAGAMLRYGASLNHTMWCKTEDTQLIAAMEFNGWSFQDGAFTDASGNTQSASNATYLSIGPTLRFVFSKNIDFGFGAAFAMTDPHWAEQLYRTELRIRY